MNNAQNAPADSRPASKRELADAHLAQMERERSSEYVLTLRARAALLVRR